MCWISKELKPLTSDGTVHVIKVCRIINGKLYGYWQDKFKYELNKPFWTNNVHIVFDPEYKIYSGNKGFHSYDATKCIVKQHNIIDTTLEVLCRGDFDDKSLANYLLESYKEKFGACLVEGCIPNGAAYYVNEYGEIISEAIELTRIIPIVEINNSIYALKNN